MIKITVEKVVIVVDKPKGMVVHPAPGHYEGTLVNALLYHCGSGLSGINGVMRPGIVHSHLLAVCGMTADQRPDSSLVIF